MEKYTVYSDPRSGINPFIPTWTSLPSYGLCSTILRTIALTPLVLIRIVLAVIAVFLTSFTEGVALLISFFHCGLARVLGLWISAPGIRLLLLSIGINSIKWERADPRRLKLRPEKFLTRSSITIDTQSSGDLIISNFTGFLDVLLLYYFFRPVYVRIMMNKSLDIISIWSMLRISIGFSAMDSPSLPSVPTSSHRSSRKAEIRGQFNSVVELQKFAEEKGWGPIVAFPEGYKSNGTVLLQWMSQCFCPKTESPKLCREFFDLMKQRCTLVAFQYDRTSRYPPPHTVYGGWYHALRLSFELNNRTTFVWTNRTQIAELLSNVYPQANSSPPKPEECFETIRLAQNRMLIGIQLIDISGEKAQDFAEYFRTTQRLRYQTKNKHQ